MPGMQRLTALISSYEGVEQGLCVAFSGGVDSALLLAAACQAATAGRFPVWAVYFDTALHPAGDCEEAGRLARELGAQFEAIKIDELAEAGIEQNPPDRCYRCKRLLFEKLQAFASEKGIALLCDGTNADDLKEYRPGLRALRELGVHSPLMECSLSKNEVRALAKEAGLAVSQKPSSPCLATRFEYGATLTKEGLQMVERAEEYMKSIGYPVVRVRKHGELARIEIPIGNMIRFFVRREDILRTLTDMGFRYVTFDLRGFRSGSMDETLEKKEEG